ncbi:MAG: hypothetical protein R3B95_09080 [Nitrospirales bacterium]|nr:hypothetical protein [Nitrospirales bacterium]
MDRKIEPKMFYDLVIGSEIFYDEEILGVFCISLEQVLALEGKGMFCDPNRLGLDTIERGFKEKFVLAIENIPFNWSPEKRCRSRKEGYSLPI